MGVNLAAIGNAIKSNISINKIDLGAIKNTVRDEIDKTLIGEKVKWGTTAKGKRLGIETDSDGFVNREITNYDRYASLYLNDKGNIAKGRIAGLIGGAYATDRIFFDD